MSRIAFVMALLMVPREGWAQPRLPIIDLHLHAYAANENGPPPLGLCVPVMPRLLRWIRAGRSSGRVIRLLPDPAQRAKLKLTRHRVYTKTGTVALDYDLA